MSELFVDNIANSTDNGPVNFPFGTTGVSVTAPNIQSFLSGSGTYTTPAGALYIRVRMVGGGGQGSGGGNVPSSGNAGSDTTFGGTLLVAGHGTGGNATTGVGGNGGSASMTAGPVGLALSGGQGNTAGSVNSETTHTLAGGSGGSSAFGGAGRGGVTSSTPGSAGAANTGGGGGGGGYDANGASYTMGPGGGSGGFIDAIISSPSATYAYVVGAGGTGGGGAGGGGSAGGIGGDGMIIVEAYFQ